jgi:predicted porin
MQTKIIALAVAGLVSGAAFAQTNVTLYGVADIGYQYIKQGDQKFSGVTDGMRAGNRIGVRGEEALGNGLKAIFNVEWGYTLRNGNATALNNTRQAWLGLSGGFGELTFGRIYAPSSPSGKINLMGNASATGIGLNAVSDIFIASAFTTFANGSGDRWDNSISYITPNLSGFTAQVIYSFGDQIEESAGKATTDASKFGVGLKYANGPLYVGLGYQTILKDKGTTTLGGVGKNDTWMIGASYDFKVVKVFAHYQEEKDKRGLAVTPDDFKKKYIGLGVSVPITKVDTINVEGAQIKYDQTKSKGLTLGYEHQFSKRTKFYAYLTAIDNDDYKSGYLPPLYKYGQSVGVAGDGEKLTNFAFGISHSF